MKSLYKSWESLVTLLLPSCCLPLKLLSVASFSEQMNLKIKFLLFSVQTYQKRKEVPYIEMSCDSAQKRKEPHKMSRDTGGYKSNDLHFSNRCSTFKNQLASFSYQHSVSFTHGLQHYCFLGQTGLHRLCGHWRMLRQIWTIFMVQK